MDCEISGATIFWVFDTVFMMSINGYMAPEYTEEISHSVLYYSEPELNQN